MNEGLRTGVYRYPQRVGIAYMLSTENIGRFDGRIVRMGRHVMFYAPFLKMDDIGGVEARMADYSCERREARTVLWAFSLLPLRPPS
jgi:hypothetical protein